MLRGRWRRRFESLTLWVEPDLEPVDLNLPPEPTLPRESGNVLLVEDTGAFSVALRNLDTLAGATMPVACGLLGGQWA